MSGERRYLLDTNALVALGEGDSGLISLLESADYVATSVICKVEYLTGIAEDAASRLLFENMLRSIVVINLRSEDASLINDIVSFRMQRSGIKLPDAIVMASAKVANCTLLTRDRQLLNADLCDVESF